jgi:hypothetical protein
VGHSLLGLVALAVRIHYDLQILICFFKISRNTIIKFSISKKLKTIAKNAKLTISVIYISVLIILYLSDRILSKLQPLLFEKFLYIMG